MAGAVPVLDEIIKEYLLFRGFTSSLKSFEADVKGDKDKSFKVTRIIDQLFTFISTYDVLGLKDYWHHLDRRFFQRLDYQHYANVKKLETCLLRLYIVHALQNSKQDKVVEFFEKYASELQQKSEWREWFAIPFIKNPDQNVLFEMYFSRSWQETFMLSLHNFLITVFHHMPMPTLIKLDDERGKLQRLERENQKLKEQVASLAEETATLQREKSKLAEIIRESEKMEKCDTVDDEDADEFCFVSSKPIKIIQQMKDTIHMRFPGRMGKSKEEKSKNKAGLAKQPSEDENRTKQKKFLKQLQQLQELQDEQKTLELLEDEQTNRPTDPPEKSQGNQQDPEPPPQDQMETTKHVVERRGALRKARSFDSCPPCNVDEVDNPEDSRRYTVPAKDLKKPSALSRGKTAEESLSRTVHFFEEETKNKAFLRLGQEEYKEHHSAVIHCRFSSSGRMIASADADGIVKVWTNHPEIKTCATIMSKSPLLSLEWATKPDRLLLLGTGNCKVRFYDTDNKKTIYDVSTEPRYPRVVSISCSPTGKAFVCSAATAPKLSSHRAPPSSALLVNEMSNVTGSSLGAGVLQYWDIKTQKMERQLALDPAPTCVNCTTFNHNGTLLVSGASDGMIRLFDMRTYDCLNAWQAHSGEVCSVQFSVDETTIYSMGADGKFFQWSVHRMGQKMADLDVHDGAVWCGADSLRTRSKSSTLPVTYGRLFAFDSEGQYVLTCGSHCGIIYRVDKEKTLTPVMNLQGHRSAVVSVDWTSSLSYCTSLTGSLDGAIQVASLLKQ